MFCQGDAKVSEEEKQEQEDEVAEQKSSQQPPNPTWVGDAIPSVPEETLGMVGKSGIGFHFALALPALLSSLG